MPNTIPQASQPAASPSDVLAAPISRAVELSGLSRSGLYREAARGNIRLLKTGRTTLVDMNSVRRFLASLPEAPIRRATTGG